MFRWYWTISRWYNGVLRIWESTIGKFSERANMNDASDYYTHLMNEGDIRDNDEVDIQFELRRD